MSISSNGRQLTPRFTIDDAFEEETDEAIRVYGSIMTTINPSQLNNTSGLVIGGTGSCTNEIINGDNRYKLTSDSESLIQDCYYDDSSSIISMNQSATMASSSSATTKDCFRHPKVRENWRMVLAAVVLLVIGVGLVITSTVCFAETTSHGGLQGAVFLVAGFICFVPGAYHVVYIYLAAKGRRGYHFHNLPLFT